MAVRNAMFVFEVVVSKVTSFVESRHLIIKSEFSDVFALELRDPKMMHITMPDPLPLPPEPVGKKGKKKKKPKPKKGKKGKKNVEPPPPPEPDIQSGQSVLFTSNAEFLIQNMKKFPMELSIWSKEDHYVFIGSASIPWDPKFIMFLEAIMQCKEPPPVEVRDDYNIFEEGSPKIIAKLGLKVTLRYLTERVTSSFRSLSEDPTVRKFLYTGMNSKVTSFVCNMRTTDADFEKNANKIENKYIKDRFTLKPIIYADYKNAPGANVLFFNDDMECCLRHADKPPESKYKPPETCPDIDFISNYVQKIIISCNDAMRSLTPRPTIRPRIRATDIDRLCYCRETSWPQTKLAERFREEVQKNPCPMCTNKGKKQGGPYSNTFDLACVRGPCGSTECKVAREVRTYIEKLVNEDNVEFNLTDLIGPCGSKTCTLAEQITNFINHSGAFDHSLHTKKGLSTQCNCFEQMQIALQKRTSCASICSTECKDIDSNDSEERCGGASCPFPNDKQQVYQVYYFTVELDNSPTPSTPAKSTTASPKTSNTSQKITSEKTSNTTATSVKSASTPPYCKPIFPHCPPTCPYLKDLPCSKSTCFSKPAGPFLARKAESERCLNFQCPGKSIPDKNEASPRDSHLVIRFDAIHNPCCAKDCNVAGDIKDFIMEGVTKNSKPKGPFDADDPCYCDCVCDFKFTKRTTYCAVCGGYECLGDDVRALPEFQKPHPCPVYHKLYDRRYINVKSPWPEEQGGKGQNADAMSTKSGKGDAQSTKGAKADAISVKSGKTDAGSTKSGKTSKGTTRRSVNVCDGPLKKKKNKDIITFKDIKEKDKKKKKVVAAVVRHNPERHIPCFTSVIPVPRNMGWNWLADDIPGMKRRPLWRPGCAHKLLVRRYRAIREPLESIIAKKKRALLSKRKKLEMKPTLVVTKKDGEYNVHMEVLKKYSRERCLYQYPYDEAKPPIVYTIGKTEEEKTRIQKQRDRRERRTARRKSKLIQSAFRDKCQEICVKAYNQAIGLAKMPNPNDPKCPCEVEPVPQPSPIIDSCSCSESETISSSDTDGDDWIIQFIAPIARWDAKAKHPPRFTDNQTQYDYLDYRVKLVDSQGNPVPRFFKGPDGKQVCSDLGGFWSPDHKTWLEIGRDGYVGPDGRWVPMSFMGPDGQMYSAEEGTFMDTTGTQYKIGVDGYVDVTGKWAWYCKARGAKSGSMTNLTTDTRKGKHDAKRSSDQTKTTPHVAAPTVTAPTAAVVSTVAKGNPKPIVSAPDKGPLKKIVLPPGVRAKPHRCQLWRAKVNYDQRIQGEPIINSTLAARGMNNKRVTKYNEIMQDLRGDFYGMQTLQKSNRACMTSVAGTKCSAAGKAPTITSSTKECPLKVRQVSSTNIHKPMHPRIRPIDSMKIYKKDSILKSPTVKSFSSRSGVKTNSTMSNQNVTIVK